MNRKTLAVVMAALALIGVGVFGVQRANAQAAATYSWEYDNQNFYRDYGLTYYFSGLTVGAEYEWNFELLDDSGLVIDVVATRSLTAVTATETVHINRTEWPADTYAPVRVSDNYGNTLTYHYLAPEFPNFPDTFEWEQSNGNTAENLKQSPGSRRSTTGVCQAPPYNETLNNGWQHTGNACSVAVLPDGYLLLHYRMDVGDYGNADTIQFHYIEPETLDVVEFQLDEMVDYNRTGHNTFFSAGSQQTHNFVVLNTSGMGLPFIDGQASAAFTVGDNPLKADLPAGAYACTREDSGGTWLSDCESVLLVSNAPGGNEWRLNFTNNTVRPQTDQVARFGQSTSQVADAYNGASEFGDTEVGYVDLTVYPYSVSRSLTYLVDVGDAAVGNTATGEWYVYPSTLPTDLASPSEMYFYGVQGDTATQPTYAIVAVTDFATGIRGLLEAIGFNNPAGQMAAFVVLVVFGSAVFWWWHMPPVIHSFWYLFVGGLILATGLASGLFQILFYITAPLIVLFGIMGQRSRGSTDIA